MVKRYPHKATIIIENGGGYIDGEYVEGSPVSQEIVGRYDPVDKGQSYIRYNENGDELVAKWEFYTQQRPISGATKISIPSKGIKERKIVFWEEYQTHSIIIL